MQKRKSNRWEISLAVFVLVISFIIVACGVGFCYFGVTQITSISDIDVNFLLRAPSEYVTSKRDVVMGGLDVLIPGIVLMVLGVVVATISVSRILAQVHEGRAILRLEHRIEQLEKELRAKKSKK